MAGAPPTVTADEVVARLRPAMTVFVPGMSGESLAFFEALQRNPHVAAGVTFVGVHFPGINTADYLGLHPQARQRAYFVSPSVRSGLRDARADLMPLDYPGIVRDLAQDLRIDVAIAQVTPPDDHGICSLGLCQDFLPSVWRRATLRIAHFNPRLPRTNGSYSIRAEEAHLAFETDSPVPTLAAEDVDEVTVRHAAFAGSLIPDGATLQFGVGRLQTAILGALVGHRRLRVYSGMVSAPITRLIDAGAIDGVGAIDTGVALGDADFYARVGADPSFYFRPVDETHDVRRIAAIRDFRAINSAVSVDLFGQVNSESLGGRLLAGAGGLPAFSAGAQLSPGGRSIILLSATAVGGKVSRICALSEAGSVTTLPRHAVDYVVTEFGIADLRAQSVDGRARALIGVAAPQFREQLLAEWHAMALKL